MNISNPQFEIGTVSVATTDHGGHTDDYWAAQATRRIVSVGGNCHPVIAEQAEAFKEMVQTLVCLYMKEAIKSDRTTLIAELEKQGQPEMANILRRL